MAAGHELRCVVLDDGAVAGTITLDGIVRGPAQSAHMGYWIDRDRNGRGLATSAVAAMLERAFGSLGLHRVEAGAIVDNRASRRVLEKNGFTFIGIAPRYLFAGCAWQDHALYQRLAD
jgi:[ribosomal protein S5]-alanine N-acetyltransferase